MSGASEAHESARCQAAARAASDILATTLKSDPQLPRLLWCSCFGIADRAAACAEAGELADRAAHAIDAEVRTEVGDRDPLVAVEDALREFPADEIVLAGRTDAEKEAQRRRFGLPIARVDGAAETAGEKVGGTDAIARDVTRGRSSRTPVMLLAAVGAVVLAAMVLISLIALVVVWLV